MKLTIPELSLVVLVGATGSGKSTFAHRHFRATEILSSDRCRGLVSDDENDQTATNDAFEVLHHIAAKRLAAGKLTVVDATNVQRAAREPLVELARRHHCLPVAVVLDVPERVCHERNAARADRRFGPHVAAQQCAQLRRSLRGLREEGFRYVHVLRDDEAITSAVVERQPLWNNRRQDHGPFDIIGDVHGCRAELEALLAKLGYDLSDPDRIIPPAGRKAVFLGDLVDRGPDSAGVLRLAASMVARGTALCVPGNHDVKLLRRLRGADVKLTHGLAETLAQVDALPGFAAEAAAFIDSLVSHYVLDDGNLVVAHAGLKAEMQGRGSGAVREFCLYGETTGETDELGLPVRLDWAAGYRGRAAVVYGHTPVPDPEWLNNTINIDTGCVYGGRLTALRWPERELVSVPAASQYCVPVRPFLPEGGAVPGPTAQQQHDEVLDIDDVLGKRQVSTRLHGNVTIRRENAAAALEVMSRFAADPKWLIHLPPTMSPCATSQEPGLLEHPAEAFAHYRHAGVPTVICQEKHMGSRAIVVVCRDAEAARRRFGTVGDEAGVCLTRTGRRFFEDATSERELLAMVRAAMDATGFWDEHATDWACLDCELMPWSAKARDLLRRQYAAVGSAARAATEAAVTALEAATAGGIDCAATTGAWRDRRAAASAFTEAYRRYCWDVRSAADLRLAPFHVLATEGRVHVDRNHVWHMDAVGRLCGAVPPGPTAPKLVATEHRVVDLTDAEACRGAVTWWEELTARGGEGMVVKPLDFLAHGPRGLVQPAVKCRGREYLRIIYGPEYDAPANLERLRSRGLSGKRSLALREFALGIEALERFVRREPLRRVHECVFGVLALESEPVDPRL